MRLRTLLACAAFALAACNPLGGNPSSDRKFLNHFHTVTISATNADPSPSGTYVIADETTLDITVTAHAGWSVDPPVGGTCPSGSWSGTVYTTGILLDDCTVIFTTTPVHAITYDGNGNDGGGTAPVDANSPHREGSTTSTMLNSGGLNKIGHTFVGWNTAANGSGTSYAPGASLVVGTTDVVLYAQYTINYYNVTYDGNTNSGGTAPLDPGSPHMYTSTVTVLGNTGGLTKIGHTFSGWNTAANGGGTSYAPGATFAQGPADVVLYAQYTPNNYAVTYNGNTNTGGSAPVDPSSPHTYNTVVTVLGQGTLVKTGYSFTGWNTAANGSGTAYSAGSTFVMGAGAVVLYAQYAINSYTVTYDGNSNTSGSAPSDPSSPFVYGSTVTVLGNTGSLAKVGHTFVGWNTASNGSGTDYAPGATFALGPGNVVLYARYTVNSYTLTYQGNTNTGGTAPTDGSSPYPYGSTVTVLGNTGSLVKTGFIFSSWNTAANGSGTTYAPGAMFSMGAGNTVLYAQYAQTYQVFVATGVHSGDFINFAGGPYANGVLGADAACTANANNPDLGKTWKALLVDGTNRRACTSANCTSSGASENIGWVLRADTTYTRPNGTILGTTNSAKIFNFGTPLANSISAGAATVFTGLATDWTTANTCLSWTSNSAVQVGTTGTGTATNATAIASADSDCSLSTWALYCVEQ